MSNIWFTSDTHFMHCRDFIYEPRGFNSITEHDLTIVRNWNSVVRPNDVVYHLGDCIMGKSEESIRYMDALNGNIKIILGNHCTDNRVKLYQEHGYEILGYADKIKISKNTSLFLCHYPTLTMPRNLNGELNGKIYSLCGHVHTKDKWLDWDKGGIYHVELDAHNCYPVSLEEVRKDLHSKS